MTDFRALLAALTSGGVEFIIVGGAAAPCGASHLLGHLRSFLHACDTLGRSQPQLLDQQRQIDSAFLGCLDAVPGRGVPQARGGALELLRRQRSQHLHD